MKKPVIAAVVLVAIVPLYCGTTWLFANAAQQKETQLLAKMEEQSKGVLRVVARESETRFFSSSEDITFEISHPLLTAILRKAGDKAVNQFVVHNDIAYGPLPGFRSIGAARIETSLVLTEEQRKLLINAVGTDKPLRFFTTLGYFGGTHFDVQSPKLEFHRRDSIGDAIWKGGNVRFNFSSDLDGVKFKGNAPGLVFNGKDESEWQINDITLNGALHRKFDLLFTGEEMFGIGSFAYTNPKSPNTNGSAKNIVYGFKSTADKQFMNINVIAESGAVAGQGINLNATHFNFGFSHLDMKSLSSLYSSYQQIQMQTWKGFNNPSPADSSSTDESKTEMTKPDQSNADGMDAEKIKQQIGKDVVALLQHSPVFTLDNVGFATSDGVLKINGIATLDRVVEEDILPELQYQTLMGKVYATADISIDQSLIDHWPMPNSVEQMKQQLAALESQGFIVRKGKKLESHLEFKEGKFTANGKPLS
ncbi:MAG TPA: YdgA family protein [Steroidobacteraceae bacterium]|jgi:uncharacterized protein YdgA (DUF945 family)|nr:YdgA family protein [Steroidobacteraceae bacterium]